VEILSLKIDHATGSRGEEVNQRTPETHVYVSRHQEPEIFSFLEIWRWKLKLKRLN
jgi:hypothetical protein